MQNGKQDCYCINLEIDYSDVIRNQITYGGELKYFNEWEKMYFEIGRAHV